MNRERKCWLCGANGTRDPLDKHHIFGGTGLRSVSEKYGATVYLCHHKCHEFGPKAAHRCRETREKLQSYGQKKVMIEQGWTVEEWRLAFGKNYLGEDELAEVAAIIAGEEQPAEVVEPRKENCGRSAFKVLAAVALPF